MKLVKKIDIHAHICNSSDSVGNNNCTPEELLTVMDNAGVEKAVLLPLLQTNWHYAQDPNVDAAQAVARYPDRFVRFCGIDPRQNGDSAETDFSAILQDYQAQGVKGVGELVAAIAFDDPRMLNFFAHAEKCGMPIIFHIGGGDGGYGVIDEFGLPRLEQILQRFPKLRLLGHSERWWSMLSGDVQPEQFVTYPEGKVTPGGRVVELMRKYPNMCGDLSAGSGYNAMTRDPEFTYGFLEEFQDRLYYGADVLKPTGRIAKALADFLDQAVTSGKISYEAYYKISRGNAEKLLGL